MLYFRPAFWMSVVMVPSLLILSWLGVWQVQRLHWKNELTATLEAGQLAPPAPLSRLLAEPNEPAWRQAIVEGAFVQPTMVRRVFTTKDGAAGYRHLTLFDAGSDGLLFVDLGFAPEAVTPGSPPVGALTVTGFLRPAGEKGWMTLPPEPAKNIWYWRDTVLMLGPNLTGQPFVADFVLDASQPIGSEPWPVVVGAPPKPVNNHLDYALTWFGLALGLIGVYLVWHHNNDRLRFGRN
ncbi:MAG: SURF1 family protein [Robiginitomaculum sp.]|nr:SURF1 family protein [Robiginitomaculum sp.]